MGNWLQKHKVVIVGFGLTLLTTLAHIFSDEVKKHPHWAAVFIVLGIVMIVLPLLHDVYEKWSNGRATQTDPQLEIIFEPLNPARRFWSVETHVDDYKRLIGNFWEHRVEIKNNSHVTLRNVSVLVERTGVMPQRPQKAAFDRTHTDSCDINPGCTELVLVNRWPLERRQEGMLAGDSAWGYGPIKVTASADNVPSVVVVFDFNYETDQMLFEKGKY